MSINCIITGSANGLKPVQCQAIYQPLPEQKMTLLLTELETLGTTTTTIKSKYNNHAFEFEFHWRMFLQGQINNKSSLVLVINRNGLVPPGNKPLPEPMLTNFYVPCGVTRPQWVNELMITFLGHFIHTKNSLLNNEVPNYMYLEALISLMT